MDPTPNPAFAARLRLAGYRSALRRFDWHYQFSDDGTVYRRAKERLEALREEQRRIDPTHAVWNEIAPPAYANGRGLL